MMRKCVIWTILCVWMFSASAFALTMFSNVTVSVEGKNVVIEGSYAIGGGEIAVMICSASTSLSILPSMGEFGADWGYIGMTSASANGSFTQVATLGDEAKQYALYLRGSAGDIYTVNFDYNPVQNHPVQIFVSPNGSDTTGDGSSAKPYATLEKAQQVSLTYTENMTSDIQIVLAGGTYIQNKTISLSSAFSGKNGYKYTIKSDEGAKLIFARALTGWKYDANGIYYTEINEGENPMSIYENEQIAYKARTPNILNGKAQYNRVFATDLTDPFYKFYYQAGEIPTLASTTGLQAFMWAGGSAGNHNWSTQFMEITGIDSYSKRITTSTKATYEMGAGSRYYMQGAKEFLDAPGEFYTDTVNKKIYYIPYNAANLTSNTLLPLTADGFYIYGTASVPAQNIVIDGLEIAFNDYPKRGIRINNGENIKILNCKLNNIGQKAVTVEGYSRYNTIANNLITNVGSDGVAVIGVTNIPESVAMGNIIENNLVQTVGRFDGNAGCIRIFDAQSNIIRYNKVSGSPRYGIHLKGMVRSRLIGNTYNGVTVTAANFRSYQKTKNNIIEFNDVSNTMQDSQDCGAIATWGVNTGNIIRNNYIHDNTMDVVTVNATHSFGFGVYNDEDSDEVIIENNIFTRTSSINGARISGLVYPRGMGNTIQNNYFVNNPGALAVFNYNNTIDNSSIDNPGGAYGCGDFTFTKNIADNSGTIMYKFEDKWTHGETFRLADYNLFKNPQNTYGITSSNPAVSQFSAWQSSYGYDINSVLQSAGFVNSEADDFRLYSSSPAFGLGIKEINQMDMGVKADFAYQTAGAPVARVFVRTGGEHLDTLTHTMPNGTQKHLDIYFRDTLGFLHTQSEGTVEVTSLSPQTAVYADGKIYAKAKGTAGFNIIVTYGGATKTIPFYMTVGEEYSVQLQDEYGNRIQTVNDLSPNAKLRAVPQNINVEYIAVLAVFKDNVLTQVQASSAPEITLGEDFQGLKIKAMVWNSLKEMQPICKETEICTTTSY